MQPPTWENPFIFRFVASVPFRKYKRLGKKRTDIFRSFAQTFVAEKKCVNFHFHYLTGDFNISEKPTFNEHRWASECFLVYKYLSPRWIELHYWFVLLIRNSRMTKNFSIYYSLSILNASRDHFPPNIFSRSFKTCEFGKNFISAFYFIFSIIVFKFIHFLLHQIRVVTCIV